MREILFTYFSFVRLPNAKRFKCFLYKASTTMFRCLN